MGQAKGPTEGALALLLQPRHGVGRQVVEHPGGVERFPVGEAKLDRPRRGGGVGLPGPSPHLARGGGEHGLHGVVELADAGEPGPEGDLAERHGGGLDENPGRLGALGAGNRQRTCAEFGVQEPLELALAVAQPRRQFRHPAPVDHPVRDKPHGAGDDVLAEVPFRRAR